MKWITQLVFDITSSFVLDALDALEGLGVPPLRAHPQLVAHDGELERTSEGSGRAEQGHSASKPVAGHDDASPAAA